ncbi:MAG: hypothetical protein H6658_19230 [Ardenticatenaceae bacterium]|nr:hypothetical protein [Ardenticatenaceae bacterium]
MAAGAEGAHKMMAQQLGLPLRRIARAAQVAAGAQAAFYKRLRQREREVLAGLAGEERPLSLSAVLIMQAMRRLTRICLAA